MKIVLAKLISWLNFKMDSLYCKIDQLMGILKFSFLKIILLIYFIEHSCCLSKINLICFKITMLLNLVPMLLNYLRFKCLFMMMKNLINI